MTYKLKLLGLAAVAALALSSFTASVASADVLTVESLPTTLTGAQEGLDVLKVHAGETRCTTVKYQGTVATSPTTTITVTPTFSGCTFTGLAGAIDMNGCDYLFHINSAAGTTTGTTDIVCPAGQEITITAPAVGTKKCIVHIPPQTGLGSVTYTNVGVPPTSELTLSLALTGIKYSQTAGTAESGNCLTADSTTTGTYTGKALITGENETTGAHIGLLLS
jgi:hypothetical protein